jgi:hypothetical protein
MKSKKTIFDWAKISILLEGLLSFISRIFKIPKKDIWPLLDEIQRELLKRGLIDDTVNDYIIKTPDLLDQRIERDVDSAIKNYEKQEVQEINMTNETILNEVEKNKYSDEQKKIVQDAIFYEKEPDGSVAQSILGGEMGIKAEWVDKCAD